MSRVNEQWQVRLCFLVRHGTALFLENIPPRVYVSLVWLPPFLCSASSEDIFSDGASAHTHTHTQLSHSGWSQEGKLAWNLWSEPRQWRRIGTHMSDKSVLRQFTVDTHTFNMYYTHTHTVHTHRHTQTHLSACRYHTYTVIVWLPP